MAFAIIISEKGGAERREVFERDEIVVGRVQGNDLMLPKGNVSRQHVNLAFRAGRFVVVDRGSTNGTYVNGHRIEADTETPVREGDRIFVGDFVLRFEAMPGAYVDPASRGASGPTPPALDTQPPRGAEARDAVSHYPLENDPDDDSVKVVLPAPPKVPTVLAKGKTQVLGVGLEGVTAPRVTASGAEGRLAAGLHAPRVGASAPAMGGGGVAGAALEARTSSDFAAIAIKRLALAVLVERTAKQAGFAGAVEVDAALAARIERCAREQSEAMQHEGELAAGLDVEALCRDATRELTATGPLGPLLDDEAVTSIVVSRFDGIVVARGGVHEAVEPPFTSEDALARAIARLCVAAGRPLGPEEHAVERALLRGELLALLPPISGAGPAMSFRRRRAEAGRDDLVQAGVVSRGAWGLLASCMAARRDVLVIGPAGGGTAAVFGALLGASSGDRAVVVQPAGAALAVPSTAVVAHMGVVDDPFDAATMRAAAKMASDRLAVFGLSGARSAQVLDAVAESCSPVLAVTLAPSARQGVERLVAWLCAARPGLSTGAAWAWLRASFDLVVEVGRLRDGRSCVTRVAAAVEGDAVALRDVFSLDVERDGASSALQPTGFVPPVVDDLLRVGALEPSWRERDLG